MVREVIDTKASSPFFLYSPFSNFLDLCLFMGVWDKVNASRSYLPELLSAVFRTLLAWADVANAQISGGISSCFLFMPLSKFKAYPWAWDLPVERSIVKLAPPTVR